MKRICIEEGCERGPDTGHALYRTSPKGELFEGKCGQHFSGEQEPIARILENDNLNPDR